MLPVTLFYQERDQAALAHWLSPDISLSEKRLPPRVPLFAETCQNLSRDHARTPTTESRSHYHNRNLL